MALVRILVDGYSLLHNWAEVAPGKPRHSSSAREELVHKLTQYYDACGTPVTIVFDGQQGPLDNRETVSTPEVEILLTPAGQTADQMIERAARRYRPHGELLVVTDNHGERDLVNSHGGTVLSCQTFIQTVESTLAEVERQIETFNQKERLKFNNAA